jgi:PAS domain S-box-containing protein
MIRSGDQSADPGISFVGSIKSKFLRRVSTPRKPTGLDGRVQIPPNTSSSKLQDFLLALFLFAILAGVTTSIVGLFEGRRQAAEQQGMTAIGSALAHSLETQLTRSLSATYSIRSMVRNDDEWARINFDWIARNLIERTGGIRNLQLAPDGIVTDIYPLQGNEDAIGRDLLHDSENRTKTLADIEARGLLLADTVEVEQRGDSMVGRLALFSPDGQGKDRFWGFVVVDIPLANLLNATNLDEIASQGYHYQLSRTYTGAGDREVLASSSETSIPRSEFDEAVTLPVMVPNSSWYLRVSLSHDSIYQWLPKIETSLVVLGAAVLAILVFYRRQRSAELRRSNQELGEQVEDLWRVDKVVDEVARIVTSTLDINDVYQRFGAELSKLVDCDRIAIYGIDQEAGTMEFKYVFGERLPEHKEGEIVPLAGTHTEVSVQTGETHVWEDTGCFQPFSFDEALFKKGLRAGITAPLVSKGEVIGVLNLRSKRSSSYGPRQQAIIERLAAQVAPAVANSELYRQAKSAEEEIRRLSDGKAMVDDVARIVTSTVDIQSAYEEFAQQLRQSVDFDRVTISVIDQEAETFEFKYSYGEPSGKYDAGRVVMMKGTRTEFMVKTGRTLVLDDIPEDFRFRGDAEQFYAGQRASINTPLVYMGAIFGVLYLSSSKKNAYDPREQDIVERLATQIGPAVANAELYKQATSADEEVRSLSDERAVVDEVAKIVTSTLDIQNVYQEFAEQLMQLVDFDRVSITNINGEAGTIEYKYSYGEPQSIYRIGESAPLERTRMEKMLLTGRTLVLADLDDNLPFRRDPEYYNAGVRASINTPLVHGGVIFGALNLRSKKLGAFGPREQAIIERLANQIAPALKNAQLYEESKKVEGELRQSEERETALLESAPEGILAANEAGEIVRVNDAALEIFGYAREELLGQPVDMLLPNDVKSGHSSHRRSYMAHPEVRHMGAGRDLYGARKDGSVVPLEIGLSFASTESGNVALAFISDISARKKAEEAERRLAEENSVMAEIGRTISSSLDINEVYEQLGETIRKLIPFDRLGLSLVNHESETTSLTWSLGTNVPDRRPGVEIPLSGAIAGEVAKTRSSIVFDPASVSDVQNRFPLVMSSYQAGLRSYLAVPLIDRGSVIGVLQIRSEELRAYSRRHLELAERIALQISGAITNSQLFAERKRLAEENSVVAEIGRVISSSSDINDVYDQLGETLRTLIPFDRFGMSLVNHERETSSATWALGTDIPGRRSGDEIPLAGSLAGEVVNTRSPIILDVGSAAGLEDRLPMLMSAYNAGLRSFLTVPLINHDSVIGILQIRSKTRGAYSGKHVDLAERIAHQIAGAITNSQLFTERKRLAEENSVMAEIGRIISSSLDVNEVYDQLGEGMRKLIPFDRFSMGLVDYESGTTSPTWTLGTRVGGRESGDNIPMEGSLAGEVVRTKSPILLAPGSVAELESQFPLLMVSYEAGLRSFIAVPLTVRDVVIGVIQIRSKSAGVYDQRHLELAARVGDQIAGAIANAQLFAECARSEEAAGESERRYRTLVNESPDMIFVSRIDDFRFVEVNDRACEHYGYSRQEFLEMDIFDIEVELPLQQEVRTLYDSTPVGHVVEVYGINKRKNGMTFPVHVRLTKLDDECALANVRDITEQRTADENQRRLSDENSVMAEIGRVISSSLDIDEVYNQLGATIRQLIPFDRLTLTTATSAGDSSSPTWIIGTDVPGRRSGDIFPLPGSLAGKVRVTKEPVLLEGDLDSGLAQRFPGLIPNLHAGLRSFLAVPLLNRGTVIGVLQLRSKTKGIYSQRHLELLERVGNQIAGAIANSQLFADRVEAEDALRDSEDRYRRLVDFSPDAILVSDKEKFLFANKAAAALYGADDTDDLVGRRWSDFVHEDSYVAVDERVRKLTQSGEAAQLREARIVRVDGKIRDVEAVGTPITYQGEPAFQAVVRDITDRKQAENQIRESLKEKEVLLQEINHRVKNNLQIVISLLNLQSRGIEDTQLQDLLRESQERIKAMALIHEKLYSSEDMAKVDFEDYLYSLTKDLRMSHGLESGGITLNVNAAENSLDIDTAIPCGLIVNELVSNSLKHAFPSNGGGEIGVSLTSAEGRNRLVVRDSGCGFPEGFDIKNTDTLGLKLVNALVDQLGGDIEIHRNGGTEICITFGSS